MDVADRADTEIDTYIKDRIHAERRYTGSKLYPIGECHYCFSDVEEKKLFCDSECASEYDRLIKLRNRR